VADRWASVSQEAPAADCPVHTRNFFGNGNRKKHKFTNYVLVKNFGRHVKFSVTNYVKFSPKTRSTHVKKVATVTVKVGENFR
jgi:hypothetical protein